MVVVLPAPLGPQQADDLTVIDGKADPLECLDGPVGFRICLARLA